MRLERKNKERTDLKRKNNECMRLERKNKEPIKYLKNYRNKNNLRDIY
jgi:hypothetical protein